MDEERVLSRVCARIVERKVIFWSFLSVES